MGMRLGAQQYGNRTGIHVVQELNQLHVENIKQTDQKRLNINSRQDDQHPHPAVRENTRDSISILHTTSLDTVAKTNWLQKYVIEGGFEVVAAMQTNHTPLLWPLSVSFNQHIRYLQETRTGAIYHGMLKNSNRVTRIE